LAFFFFFNDTATTEIYTLSLHDALPISHHVVPVPLATDSRTGQTRQGVRRGGAQYGTDGGRCPPGIGRAHAGGIPQSRGRQRAQRRGRAGVSGTHLSGLPAAPRATARRGGIDPWLATPWSTRGRTLFTTPSNVRPTCSIQPTTVLDVGTASFPSCWRRPSTNWACRTARCSSARWAARSSATTISTWATCK